jgi:hypothetical protein
MAPTAPSITMTTNPIASNIQKLGQRAFQAKL